MVSAEPARGRLHLSLKQMQPDPLTQNVETVLPVSLDEDSVRQACIVAAASQFRAEQVEACLPHVVSAACLQNICTPWLKVCELWFYKKPSCFVLPHCTPCKHVSSQSIS